MVVPSIQVSHLASSSSFFSAILQPLGINFIEAPAASRNHPAVVIFGVAGQPVLRLQQAPSSHCKLSSLVFAAPSRLAVARFLEAALRADPPQSQPQANTGPAPEGARHIVDADGVAKATVLDLDGNIMEAVYPDPRPHSSVQYNGAPVRQTQSTTSEVGRILEWNYNVASSDGSPTAAGSHARRPSIPPRSITQRSALRQATSTAPALRPDDSDQGSSLINTSTVVGALLGVAAGAVLTYGIVSRDKDQALRHETPDPGPRTLPRRATFPERPPSMEVVKTNGCRDAPKAVIAPKPDPHSQALPYSNRDSLHGQGLVAGPRRSFERDDVPRQYSSRGGTRSETVHRYAPGRGGGSGGGGGKNEGTLVGKSIDASQYGHEFDSHSRLSSRHDGGRLPNVRSRSEAPSRRKSLPWTDRDRHSQGPPPSRHVGAPASVQPRPPRPSRPAAYEPDQSSYMSARTHRAATTVSRGLPANRVAMSEHSSGHRSGGKTSRRSSARQIPEASGQARTYASARDIPLPQSQASSYVSAREIPLPASNVEASIVDWKDDMASIAPSDSISCVGTRASQPSRKLPHP